MHQDSQGSIKPNEVHLRRGRLGLYEGMKWRPDGGCKGSNWQSLPGRFVWGCGVWKERRSSLQLVPGRRVFGPVNPEVGAYKLEKGTRKKSSGIATGPGSEQTVVDGHRGTGLESPVGGAPGSYQMLGKWHRTWPLISRLPEKACGQWIQWDLDNLEGEDYPAT